MKVEIKVNTSFQDLQRHINDFIQNPKIRIIDIKFSTHTACSVPTYCAMIIYDKLKEEN